MFTEHCPYFSPASNLILSHNFETLEYCRAFYIKSSGERETKMKTQSCLINSHKRKKVSLVIAALMLYSTACGNVHSTPTPVVPTIEIPTATPEPPTQMPTLALPTETILATLTPFNSP